jgi:hypothetical protein
MLDMTLSHCCGYRSCTAVVLDPALLLLMNGCSEEIPYGMVSSVR